jgi:hypothetical protein
MLYKMVFKIIILSINLFCTALLFGQTGINSKIETTNTKIMYTPIEFQSEGATLRGRLYLPENVSKKIPVIIMAHGYSATIEGMVADRYAEVFCRGGFAVVLYDHRNLGISDGEPRQQLDRWTQARGYRDAINFVMTLPQIDTTKIGL